LITTSGRQLASAVYIDIDSQSGDRSLGSEFPVPLLRSACHLEVLIPARNEARRLPRTLERTIQYLENQSYSASVVVIDNGSFDDTTDIASAARSHRVPVSVIGCAQPGKGAAVRLGLLGSQADYVGYMDADLATPIETLDVVMPLLARYPAVVASRRIGWRRRCCPRSPTHSAASNSSRETWLERSLPG
jgi:cellulose synthase/poly-beta-1,6-N-acetylglucosamine synthase-like glycosyltransferase